jgi:hypothetical protein
MLQEPCDDQLCSICLDWPAKTCDYCGDKVCERHYVPALRACLWCAETKYEREEI